MTDESDLRMRISLLEREIADWQKDFDHYDAAVHRGIALWRRAQTTREERRVDPDLLQPGTGEMVAWLIGLVDAAGKLPVTAPKPLRPIHLTRAQYDQIVAHMRAEMPAECCGMIAGKDDVATQAHQLRNVAPAPLYQIHPDDLVTAVNIELRGDDLLAIYHSHPFSIAYPSGIDVDEARYPDTIYLIASGLPGSQRMRAYRIIGGNVYEVGVHVSDQE